MTHVVFAIPGDLATRTGGYAYARELLAHLPDRAIAIRHLPLPARFPLAPPSDLDTAFDRLAATAKDEVLLIDGLAFGALPAARLATLDRKIVALVHHPLGYETGLDEATKEKLIGSERAALAAADHVIVSSDTTRDLLAEKFGVAFAAITIAKPGTKPAACVPVERPAASPLRLVAVGSLTPRKGFEVLIAALAELTDLDWRLRLVGSPERAPETAQALGEQIIASGLQSRVDLVGELATEALQTEYSSADLFVLSSHYEGYGMVLAEAIAHGLPIVTTTGGAAARTVPDDAALKVPPGDAPALAAALCRAIEDASLRRALAAASRRASAGLTRWPATAAIIAAVLHDVAQRRRRR